MADTAVYHGGNKIRLFDNGDGTYSFVPVDSVSDTLNTIAIEHANIHQGILFSVLHKMSIATGTTAYIQIKTGSKTVHFKPTNLATDADKFAIEFLENPTLTDGTIPITVVNRNRTSDNLPETVFYSDPTNVSEGIRIDEFYIGGSVGRKATGGDIIAGVNEFILKPNTNYVFQITNEGTTDGVIMMRMFFYEM